MFASCVCLVFLIWGQVLNRSAAANEETPADDVNAVRNRTLLTVPSNGANNHSPGAEWDTKIKGTASRTQDAASGSHFYQEKLLEELKEYKFVFPHVISGNKKHRVSILPQKSYPNHISMSVELEGKELILDLRRNTLLLPRGFQVSHYDANGTLVIEKEAEPYRCCYEGSVRRFPGSQVSASTCSGLSALIVFSNRSYIIEHLAGDKHGRHLLYRPEDLPQASRGCGVKSTFPELTLTNHLQRSQRVKRDVLKDMRYVELVLVTDNNLYQNLGSDKNAVVKRMLNLANTVDLYYRPFNIRIALIGVEVWTTDQVTVDTGASATMSRFLHWRKESLLPRLYNDNAHLICGGTFDKNYVGLANMAVMCSKEHSGGVNLDNSPSHLGVSAVLAHEMGHNLGMAHDATGRNCDCPDKEAGCIMTAVLGLNLPSHFSSCSRADVESQFTKGRGVCLNNLPDLNKLVGGKECGNMYVEKGEDCDCGKPRFLPAGTVCRRVSRECDLQETCTGTSSHCPEDTYLKDGYTCSKGNLFCGNGLCQSADDQCTDIWGPTAANAESICYEVRNKDGSEFGHCGKDQNDEYIPCRPKDVNCGKLQCKGGTKYPKRGGRIRILGTIITHGNVKYNCRGISSIISDAGTPDLMSHGTKCGKNKACSDTKCVDVTTFRTEECHKRCNGNGVCNNKDNCHCDDGWAPPLCNTKGTGGSIDSGPQINKGSVHPGVLTVAILAPALSVPILGYFLGKLLFNKGTAASARSLATRGGADGPRSDIDASTSVQSPLPNSTD
ncbi:disintegrin and metalloproteinase domain-containing protein 12-like isoform X2 [Scyliorhinus canicula]|uniref:disintegrin and metalloproteinase domain-containing protein 12-like isoform X2 n=1 Tax=Scyliorhinus canicula TaxID=7830 RepID=UPI0018F645DD|nr:disintegrin and metalloproteinase domain-containing protein 12-like isoform X2 [Scyliorhinus canicula]